MNSTSQKPGGKFRFSSRPVARDNRTLYLALGMCAVIGLLFTLVQYYAFERKNPLHRLGFAVYISMFPALAALVVLKLTNFFGSWRAAAVLPTWTITALVYLLLFVLVFVGLLVK